MYDITIEDRKDMQGLLVYGYASMPASYFIPFKIDNLSTFKLWLAATNFQSGEKSPEKSCMNIAFTAKGLKVLTGDTDGTKISDTKGFDQAFVDGMDTDFRNRILGDYDTNSPEQWKWGSRTDNNTHGMLLIYAKDESTLNEAFAKESERYVGAITPSSTPVKCVKHPTAKEHFGFTDGISQPVLKGLGRNTGDGNFINPGEIILGHLNAYDKYPLSPQIDGYGDFGKNGSYMVMREMQQDVPLFWKTMLKNEGDNPVRLAAKMVGRWPNGIPLMLAETEEEANKLMESKKHLKPGQLTTFLNDFEYYEKDKDGLKCPIGAHIRRGNPKDSKNEEPKNPNEVSNKHRILRRGMPFGKFISDTMEVKDILTAIENPDHEERGLNFVCFNSDINRQFEFIQQTWMNNMKFVGLYDEVDPLIGVQGKLDKNSNSMKMNTTNFSVPECPYRRKYNDIPLFVKIRAGGYFFMPALRIIKLLAK